MPAANFANEFSAFVRCEERLFIGVHADTDDEFLVQLAAAFDDIEVPVVDWVERTSVNGDLRTQYVARHDAPLGE
jgi:hypothetical protein